MFLLKTVIVLVHVALSLSVTFKNVSIVLTTRTTELFQNGKPPIVVKLIENDNSLRNYVNLSIINNKTYEEVLIDHQEIPILEANSIVDLPNLVNLAISFSGVLEIEDGAFKNLPKLKHLNLSGNRLTEIKDNVFTNMTIEYLHLNENEISVIQSKAFNNMKMKHLFMDHNRIGVWKSEWFLGTPVESISMGYNQIKELPRGALRFFVALKRKPVRFWYLTLNHNGLDTIQKGALSGVDQLLHLDLKNNSLKTLQNGVFNTLGSISNLDLSGNQIETIETNVFKKMNVTWLKLENNNLSCFPINLLGNVRHFNISGNPINCKCLKKILKDDFYRVIIY